MWCVFTSCLRRRINLLQSGNNLALKFRLALFLISLEMNDKATWQTCDSLTRTVVNSPCHYLDSAFVWFCDLFFVLFLNLILT